MKLIIFIVIVLVSLKAEAQWPGYFYAFELKDADGNFIDSTSSNYKMKTIKFNDSSKVILDIEICNNNKTWRYYEGYKDFNKVNKLEIKKIVEGNVSETMIIEFPSSLTGGKEKHYANLYAGIIKFKNGNYKIKLPNTPEEWDALKEIELCPDPNNYNVYCDISKYQK